MRAPLLATAATCALLTACSSDEIVVVTPQTGVQWHAVLVEDEDGKLLSSTGLARMTDEGALRLRLSDPAPGAHRVRFVGFTDAQLAAAAAPEASVLGTTPLRHATATDALLPSPAFTAVGTVDGDLAVLEATTASIALTARWLPPCPQLIDRDDEGVVDIGCGPIFCDAIFTQRGCRVAINMGNCGLGELVASLDGRGAATYEPLDLLGRCEHRTVPGVQKLRAECNGGLAGACRIDAYARPLPERFDVDALELFDVPSRDGGNYDLPLHGYIGDVVVLPDHVAVATFAGKWRDRRKRGQPHRPAPAPGTVVFVHPEELRIVGTATSPPLMRHIVRDPAGDGFLGLYGDEPALGRFDAAGKLLEAVAIDPALDVSLAWPVGMLIAGTPPRLVVGFRGDTSTATPSASQVLTFDVETLAQRTSTGPLEEVTAIGVGAPDWFAALNDTKDLFLIYDVHTGAHRDSIHFLAQPGNVDFGRSLIAGDEMIVSAVDNDNGMFRFLLPGGSRFEHTVFFEWDGDPFTFLRWPADPRLLLVSVAGHDERPRPLVITLFDPDVPRFVAGATSIGTGVVGSMASDAQGRVWLSKPWAATIVRVSPRAGAPAP